jgi:uncharacterized SAM-binding protein YcdF (DUF218 family)
MQFLKFLFGIIIHLDLICAVLILFAGIAHLRNSRKKRRKLLVFSLVTFFIIHLSPISRIMLYQLEHRFPQEIDLPNNAKGLILLGGNFSLLESQSKGRPIYNLAGGRVIEFIGLARRYPNLPIVFTGSPVEVELTKKLFDEMGIDPARVTYENESQNSLDNAGNSYKLIRPRPEDKWILVTSAFHMPRSIGLFKGTGWNVTAYPVDYHIASLKVSKLILGVLDRQNPIAWRIVTSEWAGLFNNYINVKSPEFFPK